MSNLVSVRGPHARNTSNIIRIQWNMGNSCNYSCEYCPPILHDGSKPWLSKQQYIDAIIRLSTHYSSLDKQTEYELIGGEVTVIPGFEDIIKTISEHNSSSIVYSNASRTVNWWSKAKQYMDRVVLTYHPQTQDSEHFKSVINEIKDYVHIDINIAGISGDVLRMGEFAEEVRGLFKDCDYNNYNMVSICVKTMYKKLLGRQNKQETYWEYTAEEQEVLQRPGIKAQILPERVVENIPGAEYVPEPEPDPNAWMTEFLYDDGTAEYVQSHQIIDKRLNSFQGMRCHLGFESLNIDASGDMYSSWCGALNFGNIADDKWNLPQTKTTCPYIFCNNISDISITQTLD
jgi:MoaA/NifB/PqqE/SkfB family radical SAM enzyme